MAEMCMMFPDGSIAGIEHTETHSEQDKNIFRDIGEFMQMSQLGVCVSDESSISFIPISQMLSYDEALIDHAKALRDLGEKVKSLERGK